MSSDYNNVDVTLKFTIIGEYYVGKTSIIGRFVDGIFDKTYSATIGFSFLSKNVVYNGRNYTLNVWDTSGSEKHRALSPNYYRGTDGCILVYDVTNKKTVEALSYWYSEFIDSVSSTNIDSIPTLLIGNKTDLEHDEESITLAQEFARNYDIKDHLLVSALDGNNVDEAFFKLLESCTKKQVTEYRTVLKLDGGTGEKESGCC